MGLLSWLGLRPEPEVRTLTPEVIWGERTPFNQVGNLPDTSHKTALSLGPVYSSVRLLAESISTLPMKFYRRLGDDRSPMVSPPQLFAQMIADGTLVPWLHRCVTSKALRGNAFGWVVSRDGFGFPTSLEWLAPCDVAVDDRPGKLGWLVRGREVAREDIVHIPLFTLPGERLGMSPIGSYARTLGVGLQAQSYASDWFAGGGFPPGTFKNSAKTVGQEEADVIKGRLVNAIRTRTPLVYGSDWDFNPIQVPPEEAQFVETMKMTTNQIAAIYGIPPEMIGGESGSSMTYANVEQQQINFVMFTLRPWLVRLETAFSALLPDRQYVKFNADALIRADLKTRWEVNQIRYNMGAASIDEIRAQEDQPPLPDGQGQSYGPQQAIASQPADTPSTPGVVPMRRVQ